MGQGSYVSLYIEVFVNSLLDVCSLEGLLGAYSY